MFLTSRGNVSAHSVKCVKGCFQSSSEIWAVKVWVGARFSVFLAFWMQTYHSSKISLSVLFKCTLCVLQQHVCKLTPKLFFKLFLHNYMLSKADVYYYYYYVCFSVYLNSFCWGLCWFVVMWSLLCFRTNIKYWRWAGLSICFVEDEKHPFFLPYQASFDQKYIYTLKTTAFIWIGIVSVTL